MTVDDLCPRDGENLYAWLARIDPATAAYANREDLTRAEKVAFTRGLYEGGWRVLFDLFEKLDRGIDDPDKLVGMTAAGLFALK